MLHDLEIHLAQSRAVSFDLFDTLVIRPYIVPSDLFFHIERRFKLSGFAIARQKAESIARTSVLDGHLYEEYALDEIYNYMPKKFNKAKTIEIDAEISVWQRNEPVCEIYLSTLQLKPVYIVSDTYLPVDAVALGLSKLGLENYSELFVSSESRKTKRHGSLFKFVLNKTKVSPKDLVHIGDNDYSDGTMARSCGIISFIVPTCLGTYAKNKENSREFELHDELPDESCKNEISTIIALCAMNNGYNYNHICPRTFWNNFGFKFAGPVFQSFCSFIYKKTTSCTTVVFMARDCHYLYKAFKYLNPQAEAIYFPFTRKVVEQLYDDLPLWNNVKKYLASKIKFSSNVVLVDAGTNAFTAQRCMCQMGFSVRGVYWVMGNVPNDLYAEAFLSMPQYINSSFFVSGAIEFFMSAPTPPISTIKCNGKSLEIVYSNDVRWEEAEMFLISRSLGEGALRFVEFAKEIFPSLYFSIEIDTILKWNALWLESCSSLEITMLGQVRHASDIDHSNMSQLFHLPVKQSQIQQNPSRIFRGFKRLIQRCAVFLRGIKDAN